MSRQDAADDSVLHLDRRIDTTVWNHLKAELLQEIITEQYANESGQPGCGICSDSLDEIAEEGKRLVRLKHCKCTAVYCATHVDIWLKTTGELRCPTCKLVGGPDHADFPHSTDYISSAAAKFIRMGYFEVNAVYPRFGWERFEIAAIEVPTNGSEREQQMAKAINSNVGYDVNESTLVKKVVGEALKAELRRSDRSRGISDTALLKEVESEARTLVHQSMRNYRQHVISEKDLFAEGLHSGRRYLADSIAQGLKQGLRITQEYHVVEAIVGHEWADDEANTIRYWTNWLGFSEEWDTREDESNLQPDTEDTTCAEEAIDAYFETIGGRPVYQPPSKAPSKGQGARKPGGKAGSKRRRRR
ncbi:hypothetical protein LTR85_009052 [Meristemomyces frigidus]|nr:hypothetical protein LTR85_009052 [Meristemomyces frigidus]